MESDHVWGKCVIVSDGLTQVQDAGVGHLACHGSVMEQAEPGRWTNMRACLSTSGEVDGQACEEFDESKIGI